jgi:hypothetical protein
MGKGNSVCACSNYCLHLNVPIEVILVKRKDIGFGMPEMIIIPSQSVIKKGT